MIAGDCAAPLRCFNRYGKGVGSMGSMGGMVGKGSASSADRMDRLRMCFVVF